jgi:uncharacterized membrane protein (DUF485 family)
MEQETRMSKTEMNWAAIDADPRFQALHAKKTRFLWGLMIFSVVYYFLLPVGAAYYQDLFKVKVWGPVNVGIFFALSEFVVAWTIAAVYAKRANRVFDAMAQEIINDAHNIK